jgi:3-oxoacyl-[acyl-carrier protein] reductase
MRLEEKVAIVTGGGSGLGKGIALGYAKEGAHVVITARNFKRLEDTAMEIKNLGRIALPVECDVTKSTAVDKMVKKVMAKFGKIDILVNNAAIYPETPFLEISEKEIDEVFATNLKGPFLVTQAVAREMVKSKSGRIINILSSMALWGVPGFAHYTATKGGLLSVTRAWAKELSPLGINVNAISVGVLPTETLKGLPSAQRILSEITSGIPLGRLGTPEDYVGISVLLASDEGSYITASNMLVNGGLSQVQPG